MAALLSMDSRSSLILPAKFSRFSALSAAMKSRELTRTRWKAVATSVSSLRGMVIIS